ncbi:MAG: alanine racemase [Bacteroidetes bacterium]|nr:MAG: alanine racemase [Bacteroidota bacterium]
MKLGLSNLEFAANLGAEIKGSSRDLLINSLYYDSRKIIHAEHAAFFALEGPFRNGHLFIEDAYEKGIRHFVVRPDFDNSDFQDAFFYQVKSPLIALQNLARIHRQKFDYPVIAITGSVGKTIVKEWAYHCLSDHFRIVRSPKSYNSQLGVALSLLEMEAEHSLALIEAGVSGPGEMTFLRDMIQPSIGVLTNIGTAHLANFKDQEELIHEKWALFENCPDVYIGESVEERHRQFFRSSTEKYQEFLALSPYQDTASRQNLSLVLGLCEGLDVPLSEISEKIKTLPRLALRMETFDGMNGNTIINDAYNADLDALTQSLEYQMSISGDRRRSLILGVEGLDEEEVRKIKHRIKNYELYQVFFVRQDDEPQMNEIHNQVVLIKGTRNSHVERLAKKFRLRHHKTRVEINLTAVRKNLKFWQSKLNPDVKLLIMIKASSYGSGAVQMARFLEQNHVDYLGVAYVDEGIELRNQGIQLPILVMNCDENSFDQVIEHQLEPSIYSMSMLDAFTRSLIQGGREQYPIHLKFDTGMKRLGFDLSDILSLSNYLSSQPELRVRSIYSHLADSDRLEDSSFTKQQIKTFQEICGEMEKKVNYPFLKHLLNTEGVARFPEAQFDMVRIGIGLYGVSVNPKNHPGLEAAIGWKSIVSQIKEVKKGQGIGYSLSYTAPREMRIGIIPVGYADGFRRSLSNGKGGMYIRGSYCPVVGNVCMDMTMLDLGKLDVREGESVEIIGPHQSLEQLASQMETIPYEVLTSMSRRLERIYTDE